jgi:2-polyprenyl-3-methyl-5-hydroxy-6-metoxy-1,4-benzoquinol methylase
VTSTRAAADVRPVAAPDGCPLCGSTTSEVIHARDRNRRISPETFEYIRCERCGSVSLRNVPPDLARYYPESYYAVPSTLAELDGLTQGERYKVHLIQPWVASGRLVEVGPAYGMFARVAQQAGFEVDTIEMDARCCAFLRDVVGVGATQSGDVAGTLEGFAPADVIAMWHVLEHLPDPQVTLAAAASRLRPVGILVLATPNPKALQFRLFGRFWAHLDAPRHLHLLSSTLVADEGRALGLEPVLLTMTDTGSLGWNSFGWAVTLRNFFDSRPLRAMAHLAGRVINKLVAPVERRGERGCAYTIVLRRPVDAA